MNISGRYSILTKQYILYELNITNKINYEKLKVARDI
jgi:hypothetical protein